MYIIKSKKPLSYLHNRRYLNPVIPTLKKKEPKVIYKAPGQQLDFFTIWQKRGWQLDLSVLLYKHNKK